MIQCSPKQPKSLIWLLFREVIIVMQKGKVKSFSRILIQLICHNSIYIIFFVKRVYSAGKSFQNKKNISENDRKHQPFSDRNFSFPQV